MARDLKRIAECGFTGVLLHLPPEYLEHTLDKRDRYAEFVRIADSLSLKIVFMVAPLHGLEGSGVAESGALAAWLINSSLQSSPALYRVRGKPLALCHSSIRMSGPRHPAIVFQRFSKDSLDWKWRPPLDPKRLQSPGTATCSVIYTGWKGTRSTVEGGWALPRGKWCENLRGELWRAFSAKSRRIVVSSWNDFQNGDAAEPNDIDGTKASDVLTEEIRRVKLACSPSTTSSGTTGDSAARQ
ncbi:MAG: hypothetical protein KAI66_01935 [Lentisphaeria bacterium]|nr:hypothetical protein [Lentisphaeria bacterium]